MEEEREKETPGDRVLRPDVPARGLTLLIGAALLAAGVVQLVASLPRSASPVAREFAFEDVQVIAPAFAPSGPIDVNAASTDELVRLPGVGEVLAARIVADREANGPFSSLDDLCRVSGIGPATVEGFRGEATVAPPDQ